MSKTFTHHEVWSIMRDLSAQAAGNSEYDEIAAQHAAMLNELDEDGMANFVEQSELVRASLDAVNAHAEALTKPILEEIGISNQVATWSSADLVQYLGRVQTTGEFSELLSLAVLMSGDPRVLFDLAEPAEEEEGAEATDGD